MGQQDMTKEQNFYRATEKYLYNYKFFKVNIENMKLQIEELEGSYIKGMTFERAAGKGQKTSPVEAMVIKNEEKKAKLKKKIKEIRSRIRRIDKSIQALNDIERCIIKEWYFEGKQWWQIAHSVKYSERHCRRMKTNAVKKISVALFGMDPIKKMSERCPH